MSPPGPAPDPRARQEPPGPRAVVRERAAPRRSDQPPALVMVLAPVLGLLIWAGLALLAV